MSWSQTVAEVDWLPRGSCRLQFADVGDVTFGDGAELGGQQRGNGDGFAGQGDELQRMRRDQTRRGLSVIQLSDRPNLWRL